MRDFSLTTPNPLSTNRFRPLVTPGVMAYFPQPTYAMDRVHALPINARRYLAERYFPPELSDGPALCRLYFGKDYTGTAPSRFANTTPRRDSLHTAGHAVPIPPSCCRSCV